MKSKVLLISLLFSIVFLIQIDMATRVYAQSTDNGTDLNLTSFPAILAEKLSISEFAGELLASLIVMLAFMLPTTLYTKTIIPPLFVGVVCLAFCIGVGWLDYWFLLVLTMMVAFMFAGKIRTVITGR